MISNWTNRTDLAKRLAMIAIIRRPSKTSETSYSFSHARKREKEKEELELF